MLSVLFLSSIFNLKVSITCFLFQYYYFIRLMGRKASHVALECTLQSHPNMVSIPCLVLFNLILPLWGCQDTFYIFLDHFSRYNLICSLQVILGEQVAASKLTLFDIAAQICDAVQARAEQGFKLFKFLSCRCWW